MEGTLISCRLSSHSPQRHRFYRRHYTPSNFIIIYTVFILYFLHPVKFMNTFSSASGFCPCPRLLYLRCPKSKRVSLHVSMCVFGFSQGHGEGVANCTFLTVPADTHV